MDSARYKTYLAYLPGMAAVVNSFESEQVQLAVFDRLIEALDARTAGETKTAPEKKSPASSELEQDLVEGESIHADLSSDL